MKKALANTFMTSTLSVGCLKSQLRFTTDASKRTVLSDAEREAVSLQINTLVATLNTIRQHMFKAILLYIATTIHQFPGTGAGSTDKSSRSRWLDPLVDKKRMKSICQNLCSLFSGTSRMLGAGHEGDGDGDGSGDGDGGDGGDSSDDDDDSSTSSKRRRVAAAGPSTSVPAQPGSSRGRGPSQSSASGTRSASAQGTGTGTVTRARKTPASKGKGKGRAGDGDGGGGDGDGSSASNIQDNRDIAKKMYDLLIEVMGPLALVPETQEGFSVDPRAREQMSENVLDAVAGHFVELWPALNEKVHQLFDFFFFCP